VDVVVPRNQILEDGPGFRQVDLDAIRVSVGQSRNMRGRVGTVCRIIVELAAGVVGVDRVDAVG